MPEPGEIWNLHRANPYLHHRVIVVAVHKRPLTSDDNPLIQFVSGNDSDAMWWETFSYNYEKVN